MISVPKTEAMPSMETQTLQMRTLDSLNPPDDTESTITDPVSGYLSRDGARLVKVFEVAQFKVE